MVTSGDECRGAGDDRGSRDPSRPLVVVTMSGRRPVTLPRADRACRLFVAIRNMPVSSVPSADRTILLVRRDGVVPPRIALGTEQRPAGRSNAWNGYRSDRRELIYTSSENRWPPLPGRSTTVSHGSPAHLGGWRLLLSLGLLLGCGVQLGSDLKAAHGQGTRGTWVAEHQEPVPRRE
jgi:hypothetical protein